MTKERSIRLLSQQKDINSLGQQILHVLNFTHWALTNGSSTALLYSKRLVRLTKPQGDDTVGWTPQQAFLIDQLQELRTYGV